VRQSFSTIDEAKREAQVAARQIAAGLAKATGLSIAEREAYDAAKAILPLSGDSFRKKKRSILSPL
jgi:hypothetical protein